MVFVEDLAVVVIPILVGAALTYGLSQSWQKYQFKSKLKKEMIDDFYNSFIAAWTIQYFFLNEVVGYYLSDKQYDNIDHDSLPHSFPDDPAKLPENVFSEKYSKFFDDLTVALENCQTVASKISLYTEGEELRHNIEPILGEFMLKRHYLKFVIKSKNIDEFNDRVELTSKFLRFLLKEIDIVEVDMINIKIRKLPV